MDSYISACVFCMQIYSNADDFLFIESSDSFCMGRSGLAEMGTLANKALWRLLLKQDGRFIR